MDASEIVQTLNSYRLEAVRARESGPSMRDAIWKANVELYWNRYDFSRKAAWQSQQTMPEVPLVVDRWSAAIRDALEQSGRFFTITVPSDADRKLAEKLEKLLSYWLSTAGPALTGQPTSFFTVFEEQLKLAALMAGAGSVTYDRQAKRVVIETFDPRELWLDPTGRGLYRIRRREVDLHMVEALSRGKTPIYDPEAVGRLTAQADLELQQARERLGGAATPVESLRRTVVLDEYYCTLLDRDGKVAEEKRLCVVGNEKELLRGPEANPFWHGRDWVVFTPMITVPLSIYGKSYVENWAPVAIAFTEMTNLILDGVLASTMRAFAMDPERLEDPNQALEGVSPNKLFLLQGGEQAGDFIKEIELGRLPPEAITVWRALKAGIHEGAAMNETGIGQLPDSGEHSATAVAEANANSSALVRSIARTIEDRLLVPQLQLALMVGLQHMPRNDPDIVALLGQEWADAIYARRRELVKMQLVVTVRGISEFIERGEQLRNLLAFFGVLGRVPQLTQAFLAKYDVNKVLERVMLLSNVRATDFELSALEQQKAALLQSVAPAAPGGAEPGSAGGPAAGSAPANPLASLAGMQAQGGPAAPAAMMRAAGSFMGG